MDIAAIEVEINENIQRLQDLNKQMQDIGQKIGALQEEGRALHAAGLEVKGAIEGLAKLKGKEEAKVKEAKDKLILPDHSLVASDGKTVIADANAPAAPVDAATEPARNADGSLVTPPVSLEVVK